jgi:hypothetical protein
MGFAMLFERLEEHERAKQHGQAISEYGQFLYANRLNVYLGTTFEPDWKLPIYSGDQGKEQWYHDTVTGALEWWSEHKHEYAD